MGLLLVACGRSSLLPASVEADAGVPDAPPGCVPGSIKWELLLPGKAWQSSPALRPDGTIYMVSGTGQHTLTAVSAAGKKRWSLGLGTGRGATPVVRPDGSVLVHDDQQIYSLNKGGTLRWGVPADLCPGLTLLGDGTVLTLLPHKSSFGTFLKLVALGPGGKGKWSKVLDCRGPAEVPPTVDRQGNIFVGCGGAAADRHRLLALTPDGKTRWSFSALATTSPAVGSDGSLYLGADFKLYGVTASGARRWEIDLKQSVHASPAVGVDGAVYAGTSDNLLYAVTPSGALRWKYPTGGYIRSSPAVGRDGTVYFGARDNRLYAVAPDGRKRWTLIVGGQVESSPAVADDGTVYFGANDSRLYAVRSCAPGGLARSAWPAFRGGNRRTGRAGAQ